MTEEAKSSVWKLRELNNIEETALKLQGEITKVRKSQKLDWFRSTFPYVIMCWFLQQKYFVIQVRGY